MRPGCAALNTELVTVHVGSLKMTDMKLQDVKLTDHIAGRKIVRREIAGHEIDGNEIVGHENAGHEIARHCFVRSISRAALQMRKLKQRFQSTHKSLMAWLIQLDDRCERSLAHKRHLLYGPLRQQFV